MSCPRPPTRADKALSITSVAELKRKAGMLLAEFTKGKGLYWQDELWRKRVVEILEENLNNIGEFEAGLNKNKIWDEIETVISNAEHGDPILSIHYLNQLRELVGKLHGILSEEDH